MSAVFLSEVVGSGLVAVDWSVVMFFSLSGVGSTFGSTVDVENQSSLRASRGIDKIANCISTTSASVSARLMAMSSRHPALVIRSPVMLSPFTDRLTVLVMQARRPQTIALEEPTQLSWRTPNYPKLDRKSSGRGKGKPAGGG